MLKKIGQKIGQMLTKGWYFQIKFKLPVIHVLPVLFLLLFATVPVVVVASAVTFYGSVNAFSGNAYIAGNAAAPTPTGMAGNQGPAVIAQVTASPTIQPGTVAVSNVVVGSNLSLLSALGSTQCLQANSLGVVTGTGMACGGGSPPTPFVQQTPVVAHGSSSASVTLSVTPSPGDIILAMSVTQTGTMPTASPLNPINQTYSNPLNGWKTAWVYTVPNSSIPVTFSIGNGNETDMVLLELKHVNSLIADRCENNNQNIGGNVTAFPGIQLRVVSYPSFIFGLTGIGSTGFAYTAPSGYTGTLIQSSTSISDAFVARNALLAANTFDGSLYGSTWNGAYYSDCSTVTVY
jgi:hypothetical protein